MFNSHFDREDDFLTQVEKSILSCIDKSGYARRKNVTLKCWQDHKLCKRATIFFLNLLEKEGKIRIGNRGVYRL